MVYLAHEQPTAYLERDVERRLVGARHLHTAQWLVHPVIRDLDHGRIEEQRQIDAGDQQNDEAVERDLAEQERPVRREDLVELAPQRGRRVISRIDVLGLAHRGIRRSEVHGNHPLTAETVAMGPSRIFYYAM
jgi:hypothetical protein